jgi:hypothetical protein
MPPIIPFERLSDVIIDYLHDNRPALGRCGLVSKLWLPSSHFHLFLAVQLVLFDIDTALDVLCDQGSTIPSHIHYLEIEDAEPHFDNKALVKLPSFSAIKSLSILAVDWTSLMPIAREC